MPSNINSVIKNKIKKKIISDRPTLFFFQHVTVNAHIIIFGLITGRGFKLLHVYSLQDDLSASTKMFDPVVTLTSTFDLL